MMSLHKRIAQFGLAAVLTFAGCSDKPLEGKVVEEAGTIIERQAIFFLPEQSEKKEYSIKVKFENPTYAIKFETANGTTYTFQIEETYNPRLEALNLAIQKGTKVKINGDYIENIRGTVGTIAADQIEVLP